MYNSTVVHMKDNPSERKFSAADLEFLKPNKATISTPKSTKRGMMHPSFLMVASVILISVIIGGVIYAQQNPRVLQNLNFTKNLNLPHRPVTEEPVSFTLQIDSPEEDSLVYKSEIKVTGKTSPDAVVIISTDEEDISTIAGSDGMFTTPMTIEQGANHLTITVFDGKGNSKSEERTIYFATEQL
jgi:hypothetical protein